MSTVMSAIYEVVIISLPMMGGSWLCYYFIRRRWLRIVIVLLLAFVGFALMCMAAFGVAMGSGHGSSHAGPSAEELSAATMWGWPILAVLALGISWRNHRRFESSRKISPSVVPRLKTLREISESAAKPD